MHVDPCCRFWFLVRSPASLSVHAFAVEAVSFPFRSLLFILLRPRLDIREIDFDFMF